MVEKSFENISRKVALASCAAYDEEKAF